MMMQDGGKTPFQIANGYEPDLGDQVGANDFTFGHEAGQLFAAERIAARIAGTEEDSEAVRLLRMMRWMFDEDGRFAVGASDPEDVVAEVDAFLSSLVGREKGP